MAKEKRSTNNKSIANNKSEHHENKTEAVLNLTIDGSYPEAQVREVQSSSNDGFQTPCTITGVFAGLSGGSLGSIFGFGGYWIRHRLKGNLQAALKEGWGSAKTFAVMGGIYAAVNCFMLRLRQKQDAWNGAFSGCATGLALGWSNGPLSALQSCAMLGAFSYFIDGMSGDDGNAYASTLDSISRVTTSHENTNYYTNYYTDSTQEGDGAMTPPCSTPPGSLNAALERLQAYMSNESYQYSTDTNTSTQRGGTMRKSPVEMLLSPALPLLAALSPCKSHAGKESGCLRQKKKSVYT